MSEIGPHLLGRNPSPHDPRDYDAHAFLVPGSLDAALANVLASKQVAQATKDAFSVVIPALKALQPVVPVPVPPTPTGIVSWTDPDTTLDQGNTGHCVGFGWAQWGNTDPVEDHLTNADGDAIYYECKVIDGEPNQENGSDVRSGAKAMKARGHLGAYAFAKTLADAVLWLQTKGPVVFGTDWTEDMFSPDLDGRVHPTGKVAGGHCYLADGYDPVGDILFHNSWGDSWGVQGRFRIAITEFSSLFANYGEACMAIELS